MSQIHVLLGDTFTFNINFLLRNELNHLTVLLVNLVTRKPFDVQTFVFKNGIFSELETNGKEFSVVTRVTQEVRSRARHRVTNRGLS